MNKLSGNIFIVIITVLIGACSELSEDLNGVNYNYPIKIAYLGPFSEVRMGAEGKFLGAFLAAEEINQAGGILGRDIEIIRLDDGGSAEIGIASASKAYAKGIKIILGPDWSSVTIPVAKEVTIPNTMLLMGYSATSPEISTLNDNNLVWRTPPSDLFQGWIGANYCYSVLGAQTAAILCFDNAWAIGLSNAFQDNFNQLGGTVTQYVVYPELFGDEIFTFDYSKYLDTVFADMPDVVYLASFPADGAKLTNDIALNNYLTSDYHPTFFSNDGLFSNYFVLNGNKTIINSFIGTVPGSSSYNTNYQLYSGKYEERWGFEPVGFSEHAYDAVYLLAYAMLRGDGTESPLAISSNLQAVSDGNNSNSAVRISVNQFTKAKEVLLSGGEIDYDGASGTIDFDENGDPGSGSYILWKIQNNEYVMDTTISFP